MLIESLKLQNYRNHKHLALRFEETNMLVGVNGAGKTNVLEAINLLSTGKSSKSRYDADLINYEHPFCTIKADIFAQQDKFSLEMQILKNDVSEHSSSKRVKINKVTKSLHGFCGVFNSVLFMPEDIQLITGSPSERRHYMDALLTQTDQKYKRTLGQYIKAVRQRNKILEKIREEGRGYDELEFWDEKILEEGSFIQGKRQYLFEKIQPEVERKGKELNNSKNKIEVIYKKNEMTREHLSRLRDREIAAKTTLVGPHRDDFELLFDEKNVSEFGSRGQQRSTILALKLCEIDFIEKEKGERPVLLLDDIFSEFDESHQHAVIRVIKNQQTVITSTDGTKDIGLGKAQIIEI